ncbi:S66 peptidase family protein [Nocardioides sp. LHG3406-4]|uniref:S66 peptidase family protein n=1 Tax=Nocardioides sp. LHG3406-4 TaxID=2804575 RepID=UPI003CF529DE
MSQELPRALSRGDLVALVSPASWSSEEWIETSTAVLECWGLRVRCGVHADDRLGYLAGRDEDRLADLNAAIRDPEVRAVITLRGGCGSSRLLAGVDVDALAKDPKPLVGYSDITALHRLWHMAGVPSLHGAVAGEHAEIVRDILYGGTPAPVRADPTQFGAELTTGGRAVGKLFGGNLEMLARSVGVLDFDMRGHVLLLEINKLAGLGNVDRALTQLLMSGALDGVVGVALGWLTGFEDYEDRGWTILDVLRDRLGTLDVPLLAGLPFGHDSNPRVAPLNVPCTLDADDGILTLAAALR